MFEMRQCGDIRDDDDGACPYNIIFDKATSVKEFIDYITQPNSIDWGYVFISKDPSVTTFDDLFQINRLPRLEYIHSTIKAGEDVIKKYGTKTIIKATADGNWINLNYVLLIN